MRSKSINGTSAEEIETALRDGMADGFRPTLAIIFISIEQDRAAVSDLFRQQGIDILGMTSCGEFGNGAQTTGAISILMWDLSRDNYSLLFEEIGGRSVEEAAAALSKNVLQKFDNPALILGSTAINLQGEFLDGETLVQTVAKNLGAEKVFFGGMAGDDGKFTGTYIFTHEKETAFGIAAIVLNAAKVELYGMAITGWKRMGISRNVTKASGNLLIEIDGKPAIEMYFKYLGKADAPKDSRFDMWNELSIHHPFIVERPGGETAIRSPMNIDEEANALVMDIAMAEGTKFWFSMPPDFDIVEEILDEAKQLKDTESAEADALLIFSCAGRPPVLGPLVTAENEGLAEIWQAPMAGFFTYGEFGRAKKGKQEFHSAACCWVAIKEK